MAAKVGILAANQNISDKPEEFWKRAKAEAMVRRMFLEKINRFLYRRLSIKACRIYSDRPADEKLVKTYIPENLPANIDYKLGLTVQAPILANQVRFRPLADQRSHPAY